MPLLAMTTTVGKTTLIATMLGLMLRFFGVCVCVCVHVCVCVYRW